MQPILKVTPHGRTASLRAWYWDFIGRLIDNEGKQIGSDWWCYVCYLISDCSNGFDLAHQTPFKNGTGHQNWALHLKKVHHFVPGVDNLATNNDMLNKELDSRGNLADKTPVITQEEFCNLLSVAIVKCNWTFNTVEKPAFVSLINRLNPNVQIPSRSSVTSHLVNLYDNVYRKVHQLVLRSSLKSIGICLDLWHCKAKNLDYIAFNCHLNIDCRPVDVILKFQEIEAPHTAEHISLLVDSIKTEFDLGHKKIFFTTDEGRNLISSLATETRNRCTSHGMHNWVQDVCDADENLRSLLSKGRQIVHCLRTRQGRVEEHYKIQMNKDFERAVLNLEKDLKEVHLELAFDSACQSYSTSPKLVKECRNRWSSAYAMLQSLQKHKFCVIDVLSKELMNDLLLSTQEWANLDLYCELLEQFKVVADELSTRSRCNISSVLVMKGSLRKAISESKLFDKSLREKALQFLENRMPATDELVIASILDPMWKDLRDVNNYLSEKGITKKQFIINYAKSLGIEFPSHSRGQAPCEQLNNRKRLMLEFSDFDFGAENEIQIQNLAGPDEIDSYLDLNPLQIFAGTFEEFWKTESFPTMKLLARNISVIQASQISSESTFSRSKLFASSQRANMTSHNLSMLVFISKNLDIANDSTLFASAEKKKEEQHDSAIESSESKSSESSSSDDPPLKIFGNNINYQRSKRRIQEEFNNNLRPTRPKLAKKFKPSKVARLVEQFEIERQAFELSKSIKHENEVESGQDDNLKAARIRELLLVIESEVVTESEIESHAMANDAFSELANLEPSYQIGAQKHRIVVNGKRIDVFQIVSCMQSEIQRLQLTDCIVLHGEVLTNNSLLIRELNEKFEPKFKRIFLPINLGGDHWVLLHLNLNANRSMILDSALSEDTSVYVETFHGAFKLLQCIILRNGDLWRTSSHRFTIVEHLPQQQAQSLDCGVFCFNYFQAIVDKNSSATNRFELHSNYRRYQMNCILKSFTPPKSVKPIEQAKRTTRSSTSKRNFMFLEEKNLKDLEQPDILINYLNFSKLI